MLIFIAGMEETKIIIGEMVYELKIIDTSLYIRAFDKLLCEEYSAIVNSEQLSSHLINNIQLFYRAIIDGLNNAKDAIKLTFRKTNGGKKKIFYLRGYKLRLCIK